MFRLISTASIVMLGGADLMPTNAQSIRPVAQMEVTSAAPDAIATKQAWFAHAIDHILTGPDGLPEPSDTPQQGRSAGH